MQVLALTLASLPHAGLRAAAFMGIGGCVGAMLGTLLARYTINTEAARIRHQVHESALQSALHDLKNADESATSKQEIPSGPSDPSGPSESLGGTCAPPQGLVEHEGPSSAPVSKHRAPSSSRAGPQTANVASQSAWKHMRHSVRPGPTGPTWPLPGALALELGHTRANLAHLAPARCLSAGVGPHTGQPGPPGPCQVP